MQLQQIGGIVRGAFAGGRLSGKHFQVPPKFDANDIRAGRTNAVALAEFARCAAFGELLSPQRGMIQLALRYLLDLPTTHTIILGGKCLEDYQSANRATEIPPLTKTERARCAALREQILPA